MLVNAVMDCMQRKVRLKVVPAKSVKAGKKFIINTKLDRRVHDIIDFVGKKTGLEKVILHIETNDRWIKIFKDEATEDKLLFNLIGKTLYEGEEAEVERDEDEFDNSESIETITIIYDRVGQTPEMLSKELEEDPEKLL